MTSVASCTESQTAQLDRNEALRGPPPGAVERVRAAIARGHIYPHEAVTHATAAAAAHLGVEPAQTILTTGVDEAADLCILELGDPYTVTPGFDGYGDRAAALNHRCRAFELTAEHALPRELIEAAGAGRLVMLASPNNPTANAFAPESLRALLERSAHLLLDETYADFCAAGSDTLHRIDLNLASVDATTMSGSITTQRTAINVSGKNQSLDVNTTAPAGVTITVNDGRPIHVTKSGSVTFSIEIDAASVADGQYEGRINLVPRNGGNVVTIPVAFVKTQGSVTLSNTCSPATIPASTNKAPSASHCTVSA
ncbi:MAG: aminotransferase class I/II-fold pyridoxal phosphate-dependent enzyme, partial [Solirubrobacteraceae bacterium]